MLGALGAMSWRRHGGVWYRPNVIEQRLPINRSRGKLKCRVETGLETFMVEWRRREAAETIARQARVAAEDKPTPPANTGASVTSSHQAPESYRQEEHHPQCMIAARR